MKHFDRESTVNPIQLAANQAEISGFVSIKSLTRLTDLLYDDAGQVELNLRFTSDAHGRACVQGEIHGCLHLVCQRCFGRMDYHLKDEVALVVVASEEEAKHLPAQCDPWLTTEETPALLPLIEEELLLSLPLVGKHAPRECPVQVKQEDLESPRSKTAPRNPFADLKKRLKGELE